MSSYFGQELRQTQENWDQALGSLQGSDPAATIVPWAEKKISTSEKTAMMMFFFHDRHGRRFFLKMTTDTVGDFFENDDRHVRRFLKMTTDTVGVFFNFDDRHGQCMEYGYNGISNINRI